MGLASSQARLLLLTARQSDNEFRGQQINNRRLSLAQQTEQIAKKYSDGISNRNINITLDDGDSTERLSMSNLSEAGYTVYDANGNKVKNIDQDLLEVGLRNGAYHLETGTADSNGSYVKDWRTETGITDDLDTTDDEAVTAEYEYQSAVIQTSDKQLELELKQLDTAHKAIETELEAVKKVIEKNIEKSFKTFA